MLKKIVAACVAVALLCVVTAMAEEAEKEGGYSRAGLYVGLAGNYTIQQFDASDVVDVSNSLGVSGRIGYRVHPVFAAELGVDYFNDFNIAATLNPDGSPATADIGKVDGVTVTANGKLYSAMVTGRVQPYAVAGLGMAHFEARDTLGLGLSDDATELVLRVGGGFDVYATEHIVVNLEISYAWPQGTLEGLNYVPFLWGVQYRF